MKSCSATGLYVKTRDRSGRLSSRWIFLPGCLAAWSQIPHFCRRRECGPVYLQLIVAKMVDQMAAARVQNPSLIPTENTWFNTRLHTPINGAVKRTGSLWEGTFGKVRRAIDIDSGCLVAIKEITLRTLPPKGTLRRDMVQKVGWFLSVSSIICYSSNMASPFRTLNGRSLKAVSICPLP